MTAGTAEQAAILRDAPQRCGAPQDEVSVVVAPSSDGREVFADVPQVMLLQNLWQWHHPSHVVDLSQRRSPGRADGAGLRPDGSRSFGHLRRRPGGEFCPRRILEGL